MRDDESRVSLRRMYVMRGVFRCASRCCVMMWDVLCMGHVSCVMCDVLSLAARFRRSQTERPFLEASGSRATMPTGQSSAGTG